MTAADDVVEVISRWRHVLQAAEREREARKELEAVGREARCDAACAKLEGAAAVLNGALLELDASLLERAVDALTQTGKLSP